MKNHLLHIILFSISFLCAAFAQEKEVENSLKLLEKGKADSVRIILKNLQKKYPSSPTVMYLDGRLTENGKSALSKYLSICTKYPDSKYADAAHYHVYCYYSALGNYKNANNYLQKLKTSYPSSSYVKMVDGELKTKPTVEKKLYTHTIQAGAFINKDNALALKSDLQADGYITEIKEKSLGGTILHVVCAGRFTNEKEAAPVLAKINKEYKLNGRIVLLNK